MAFFVVQMRVGAFETANEGFGKVISVKLIGWTISRSRIDTEELSLHMWRYVTYVAMEMHKGFEGEGSVHRRSWVHRISIDTVLSLKTTVHFSSFYLLQSQQGRWEVIGSSPIFLLLSSTAKGQHAIKMFREMRSIRWELSSSSPEPIVHFYSYHMLYLDMRERGTHVNCHMSETFTKARKSDWSKGIEAIGWSEQKMTCISVPAFCYIYLRVLSWKKQRS